MMQGCRDLCASVARIRALIQGGCGSKAVALNWGTLYNLHLLPRNIWQCLQTALVAKVGNCCWHLVGRVQGCCQWAYSAQGTLLASKADNLPPKPDPTHLALSAPRLEIIIPENESCFVQQTFLSLLSLDIISAPVTHICSYTFSWCHYKPS